MSMYHHNCEHCGRQIRSADAVGDEPQLFQFDNPDAFHAALEKWESAWASALADFQLHHPCVRTFNPWCWEVRGAMSRWGTVRAVDDGLTCNCGAKMQPCEHIAIVCQVAHIAPQPLEEPACPPAT